MRKILRPRCICCRKDDAVWESERWPTVQLCYPCTRDTAQIIVQRIGVKDGNPILLELVRGLDVSRGTEHRFWVRNRDNSFSECWVNERDESAMDFENPLDILHQL
jgi:hypothetical protein